MSKIAETISRIKMLWHDSEETNIKAIAGKSGKFDLLLGGRIVGTLCYMDNIWTFSYSEEFKAQDDIAPLVNFPDKERVYKSGQLWPFFASRLPGNAKLKEDAEDADILTLLQKYGKHVITNPYVLV